MKDRHLKTAAKWRVKKFIPASAILAVLIGLTVGAYRLVYPYGERPCCLPCTLEALREFAAGNSGNFPKVGTNSMESLLELYPKYLVDRTLLAGISGNRKLLEQEILTGAEITDDASSWAYWPGFGLDDDPEIAIIWERKAGLGFDGRRSFGHAVGFISGEHRQVPDVAWESFLKQQDTLRQNARNRISAPSSNR